MTKGPKARMVLAAGLLTLALFQPGLAAKTFESSRLALAVGVSGDYVISQASDHRNLFGFGASFFLGLSRYFALEFSGQLDRGSTLGDMANPETTLSQGVLQQIPVQLLAQFRIPLGKIPVVPYLAGGGGYAFNSFSLEADMVTAYKSLGFDISESVKNSLFWCVGAGVDVVPARRLIINVHYLYRSSQADGNWSISDEVTGEAIHGTLTKLNLKAQTISLGLKYVF